MYTLQANATPLYPPAHADTRDRIALARGAVLGVHARTQNERTKKVETTKSTKKNGENKQPLQRSGE